MVISQDKPVIEAKLMKKKALKDTSVPEQFFEANFAKGLRSMNKMLESMDHT